MDKGYPHPPGARPRLLVYEVHAVALELGERLLQVIDLEGDVVEALAAFRQEFPDRRIGTGRLDEFDRRFSHPEHGRDYALLLDDLRLPRHRPEVLPIEPEAASISSTA